MSKPTHTDDRTPRFRPTRSGLRVFWHPCCICGSIWGGSFGFNYGIEAINNGLGEWYCKGCKTLATKKTTKP